MDIKKLREEFSATHTEVNALIDKSATVELTAEEKATKDAKFARLETIKNAMDEQAKFAKLALDEGTATLSAEPEGKKEYEHIEITDRADRQFDKKKFAKSANTWAKTGDMDRQFATITTATQSGLLLPVGVAEPIVPAYVNTFRQAFGVYGLPVTTTPTTEQLNYPILDANAGGVVPENNSSDNENTPGLTKSILSKPATYESGSVWFSNQELNAVSFDLIGATLPSLVFSKELGIESTIVSAMQADSNITQIVYTATTAGLTFTNMNTLNRTLPKKFDRLKVIVLSKDCFAATENLQTSIGGPIMTPDPQEQSLQRFHGTPVLRSDYFSTFGANNVVGAIVSLVGFHFRDCDGASIARYSNYPARRNQTGFNLFGYHAYGYDVDAVALLKCPAS